MIFEVKIPMVGESITEVVMGEWQKSDGDYVELDDHICTIESEKAAMEITAEESGVISIKAKQGETLAIGAVIAQIDTETQQGAASSVSTASSGSSAQVDNETHAKSTDKLFITPLARTILEEAGIAPEAVKGTGPNGKISKADAIKAVEAAGSAVPGAKAAVKETAPSGTVKASSTSSTGDNKGSEKTVAASGLDNKRVETRVPMSTLRKTIASHLVAAKNETAMLTTINEIDMSEILKMREDLKEEFFTKHGVKLGFMSFFSRAVCIALMDMPVVNSRIDGNEIVAHHYCDLSIAVSSPRGLVVPVVRDAQAKNLAQLETQILALATKARDGKLTLQEMSGGTFTITNGGVFGSLISTPIINIPQSAVLGMHTIQERPIALNGQVVIRPMMYVSLSYDHRIIDGRESVLFLVHVKKLLENPHRLLLEL